LASKEVFTIVEGNPIISYENLSVANSATKNSIACFGHECGYNQSLPACSSNPSLWNYAYVQQPNSSQTEVTVLENIGLSMENVLLNNNQTFQRYVYNSSEALNKAFISGQTQFCFAYAFETFNLNV
jgi:hypothetical protein